MPVYLSGLGSVTAFNTANIKSRADGQIMRVNVREGQHVRQGDLLVEIDSRPFQVQLEQAEGDGVGSNACARMPSPTSSTMSFTDSASCSLFGTGTLRSSST